MARIRDLLIDQRAREVMRDLYQDLQGELSTSEVASLAGYLGVQPTTLEGWLEGRGEPIPKTAIGKFSYSGEIPETWQNRVLLAELLSYSGIEQIEGRGAGRRERIDTYRDDVSGSSLTDVVDRAKQYLQRETEDSWADVQWRTLRIEPSQLGSGFDLIVEYSRDYDEEFGQ